MNWLQVAIISAAVALFFVLYLGCDTKSNKQQALEKSRAMAIESTDINSILQAAKSQLTALEGSELLALEQQLESAGTDEAKVAALKGLSGVWYQLGQPAIAGTYAQNIAELTGTEEAWSITGTTYAICLQNTQEDKVRSYCMNRAVKAFENAISINPENLAHRVNLALCYTENPPQDNPMKGILMLRALNEQQPDNVLVLNTLARLALKTNQFDRAVERLEQSYSIEPQNPNTVCLLAQAYQGSGQSAKASEFAQRCKALSEGNS